MSYKQDPPNAVQIEFVQGCPLKCDFCGLNGMESGFHFMTEETLCRVADQIKVLGWNSRIEIAMHGEPTAHIKCAEFVHILRQKLPKSYITMLTNGYGLRENSPDQIVNLFTAGLNCLGIEEYNNCSWGNDIKTVVQTIQGLNIHHYPADKLSGNIYHREMNQRLIFLSSKNKPATAFYGTICNHCGAAAPKNDRQIGRRCAKVFREISIRWDGWVAICCNDFRGEYRIGNIHKLKLDEIWQHPRFMAARRKLYHGQRDFAPCAGCDARSYRVGLLPDRMGKDDLPQATKRDIQLLQESIEEKSLANIVLRSWEQ